MADEDRMRHPGSELDSNLGRIDASLEIMERHGAEMADSEDRILESMKRAVREYKDTNLHSIPKPRKHMR